MKKIKYQLAGLPVYIDADNCELNYQIKPRARQYFGPLYNKGIFNLKSACYIDNYLTVKNFLTEEEERRETAWKITCHSMKGGNIIRPDKHFENLNNDKIKKFVLLKVNELMELYPEGWVTLSQLCLLEKHTNMDTNVYFNEIIVKNGIEHQVNRKSHKGQLVARINMLDYLTKYFCKKYKISLSEIDI